LSKQHSDGRIFGMDPIANKRSGSTPPEVENYPSFSKSDVSAAQSEVFIKVAGLMKDAVSYLNNTIAPGRTQLTPILALYEIEGALSNIFPAEVVKDIFGHVKMLREHEAKGSLNTVEILEQGIAYISDTNPALPVTAICKIAHFCHDLCQKDEFADGDPGGITPEIHTESFESLMLSEESEIAGKVFFSDKAFFNEYFSQRSNEREQISPQPLGTPEPSIPPTAIANDPLEDTKRELSLEVEKLKKDDFGIIAIDGSAGTGKGTLAQNLSEVMGIPVLDTGSTYRSFAYAVYQQGARYTDKESIAPAVQVILPEFEDNFSYFSDRGKARVFYKKEEITPYIRGEEISRLSSFISTVPEVRELLVNVQRKIATSEKKGMVVEGRDIGTVVFPDARVKLFLVGDILLRAQRRFMQHKSNLSGNENAEKPDLFTTISHFLARDLRDHSREKSPIPYSAPSDAHSIDITENEKARSESDVLRAAWKIIANSLKIQ
jgi:cytidylate kinase